MSTTTTCAGCERIREYAEIVDRSSRITEEGRTWGLMHLGAMRREHRDECTAPAEEPTP